MSPSQEPTPINPTYLKNQFAHRFVRALNNLKTQKRSSHVNQMHRRSRSRRVKIAAYTAMASVVGSRRAWSRAILWKIRNRSRNKDLSSRIMTNHHHHHAKVTIKRRNPNYRIKEDVYSGQDSKLRKLVPGGGNMDLWCLVDEAADYIKCLALQVEVMQTLVNIYTAT